MITLSEPFTNTAVLGIIDPMPELDEMITVRQAKDLAREMGERVTVRSIARAAKRGNDGEETGIIGAKKLDEDAETSPWLFTKVNFIYWLNNRKPRGPKIGN